MIARILLLKSDSAMTKADSILTAFTWTRVRFLSATTHYVPPAPWWQAGWFANAMLVALALFVVGCLLGTVESTDDIDPLDETAVIG